MKKTLTGLFAVFSLLFVLCFPRQAMEGASEGLLLWFNQLIPALFPCMLLTQLLLASGLLDRLGTRCTAPGRFTGLSGNGLYVAILGMLCGCPMGAKLTADFYRTGRISRTEALRLLCFTSQLSPAFLIDFVAYNSFLDPLCRKLLLTSYYMSPGLMLLFVRCIFRNPSKTATRQSKRIHQISFSDVQQQKEVSQIPEVQGNLDTSITNSLATIVHLGGYIILFSVIASGFRYLSPLPTKANCIALCTVEITTGIQQLQSNLWPLLPKAVLLNSLCAFGGLCGMMQVQSVLRGSTLPLSVYIAAKLVQALLTAICTAVLFLFFVL